MYRMGNLTQDEKDILKVVKNELNNATLDCSLKETKITLDSAIDSSEMLLRSLGIKVDPTNISKAGTFSPTGKRSIKITPFEDLLTEANTNIARDIDLGDIFTPEEIKANADIINKLNEEFNSLHRLDKVDWAICSVAGLVAAAINIILVGIPHNTVDGTRAGTMSDWIRDMFDKAIPPDKIKELEKKAKVPFDASMNVDNKGYGVTDVYVDGLTPYFHRLVSLGHDPLLGLIFGVLDAMAGTMTTIDRNGEIVRQLIPKYSDRVETNLIEAIKKVINHLKSDVNTSMGLPVPLMALFNLFQFGNIGEQEQTIAEIVQGMYYDGYDFIHFCSMSIPVIIIELGVRISYAVKRIKEGHSIKDSIPVTINREKRPKLGTMLFTAHTIASAVNAGKVTVAAHTGVENPFLAINYPQWLAFIKTSLQQLKWVLLVKPEMRHKYVMGIIEGEWHDLYNDINYLWESLNDEYVFEY